MLDSKDVFTFYQEYVKPLYCEIEARNNSLPVELLFEVHAAFDHLKRHYVAGEDKEECCRRAISHLKRGSLDAFKLKLKYFNGDVEALKKSNIDLTLLDNGKLWPKMLASRDQIVKLAKAARMQEGLTSPEEAFNLWQQVSISINDFEEKYFAQSADLEWARIKTFSWRNKDTMKGLIVGFVAGLLVWGCTSLINLFV